MPNTAAVCVDGIGYSAHTTFKLYGGTISNNTASGNKSRTGDGGGVLIGEHVNFTMYGGTISGNKATAYTKNGSSTGGGGGVYAQDGFTMTGGSITNNDADGSGGGVYAGSNFTMTGGSITGNSTAGKGGGVYCTFLNSERMTVTGKVTITGNKKGTADNNVYFASDRPIVIKDGWLNSAARIGVNTNATATSSNPVKIATGASNSSVKYTGIFMPDEKTAYSVSREKDSDTNEYCLYLVPHTHSYTTYTARDATITAVCSCGDTGGGTVTINAPTSESGPLTYDNKAKEATLTKSDDWKGGTVKANSIVYKQGTDTFSTAPKNAGSYTASITVGEGDKAATASVDFTIGRAELTPDDLTFTPPGNLTYNGQSKTATGKAEHGRTGIGDVTVY